MAGWAADSALPGCLRWRGSYATESIVGAEQLYRVLKRQVDAMPG